MFWTEDDPIFDTVPEGTICETIDTWQGEKWYRCDSEACPETLEYDEQTNQIVWEDCKESKFYQHTELTESGAVVEYKSYFDDTNRAYPYLKYEFNYFGETRISEWLSFECSDSALDEMPECQGRGKHCDDEGVCTPEVMTSN